MISTSIDRAGDGAFAHKGHDVVSSICMTSQWEQQQISFSLNLWKSFRTVCANDESVRLFGHESHVLAPSSIHDTEWRSSLVCLLVPGAFDRQRSDHSLLLTLRRLAR